MDQKSIRATFFLLGRDPPNLLPYNVVACGAQTVILETPFERMLVPFFPILTVRHHCMGSCSMIGDFLG